MLLRRRTVGDTAGTRRGNLEANPRQGGAVRRQPRGSGPGVLTLDGCAVDLYRRLPALGVPELIDARIGRRATILDLGCGAGRLAEPLARLGHSVTGVDFSAEMLSHLRRATAVYSPIEQLRLAERFDVVLCASNLVNRPSDRARRALLGVVSDHLRPTGRALLEWQPPAWFDGLRVGETRCSALGEVATELVVHARDGDLLRASVTYRIGDAVWVQRFTTRRLSAVQLQDECAAVGLELREVFGAHGEWCEAVPTPALGAAAGSELRIADADGPEE